MNETVQLTCPRCKHQWQQPLAGLDRPQIIYRGQGSAPLRPVEQYRARCPLDGTYVVFEAVEEEDGHG